MLQSLSPRLVFFGLAIMAVIAMLFARVYLEQILGLAPCPLCMTQRIFVVLWGVIALVAALHNPARTGRRIYATLCAVAALAGAAVAVRHVWIQHLPPDQVPACGPSLEYMLDTLPFSETVNIVLKGDGNCAAIDWTFLGLSIPEQTLVMAAVVLAICLWLIFRK
ncbi:MAG: disulfide bond formation protein B [Halioglobus sp.]|nr:disulfide bond formation protein B [Halioglobus sp.]